MEQMSKDRLGIEPMQTAQEKMQTELLKRQAAQHRYQPRTGLYAEITDSGISDEIYQRDTHDTQFQPVYDEEGRQIILTPEGKEIIKTGTLARQTTRIVEPVGEWPEPKTEYVERPEPPKPQEKPRTYGITGSWEEPTRAERARKTAERMFILPGIDVFGRQRGEQLRQRYIETTAYTATLGAFQEPPPSLKRFVEEGKRDRDIPIQQRTPLPETLVTVGGIVSGVVLGYYGLGRGLIGGTLKVTTAARTAAGARLSAQFPGIARISASPAFQVPIVRTIMGAPEMLATTLMVSEGFKGVEKIKERKKTKDILSEREIRQIYTTALHEQGQFYKGSFGEVPDNAGRFTRIVL